uniref:Laminin G domain-containing protein n=1 Tax=Accipiter nisus TaxID=211598 RepID=A0A8B9RSQ1_9AVES
MPGPLLQSPRCKVPTTRSPSKTPSQDPCREEYVATFKGNEFFCYDLSHNPIQSSTDELTLSFRTLQRNGLLLHTGKSADYVNLSLKSGAVWLVINLGSGAFEALVEPVNGKFNDNDWHDIRVTRNLRQVGTGGPPRRGGGLAPAGSDGSGRLGQLPSWEHWVCWSASQLGALGTLVSFPTGSTGHLGQLPNWDH